MLQRHKEVFFAYAELLDCWIALREPNKLSEKWMGRQGYTPKSESCKAKTADDPKFPFAGLVVDPILCPAAFQSTRLAEAVAKWKKFANGKQLPPGFSCAQSGKEMGILKYRGSAIHADYDLMAICKADKNGKMVYTNFTEQNKLYAELQPRMNRQFGTPLIQHGPEFAWTGGVGASESENILFFGPKRGFMISRSSMPVQEGTMH